MTFDSPAPVDDPSRPPGLDPSSDSSPQPAGDGGLLEGLEVNAEDVVIGGAGALGAGALSELLSGAGKTAGGAAGVMAGLPSLIAAQSAQNSQQRPKDQQTWFDKLVGDALGNAGGGNGDGGGVSPMMVTAMEMPMGTDQGNTADAGRETPGGSMWAGRGRSPTSRPRSGPTPASTTGRPTPTG